MNKKTYQTPTTEIVCLKTHQLLATSTTVNGLDGFGGYGGEGSGTPDAPEMNFPFD